LYRIQEADVCFGAFCSNFKKLKKSIKSRFLGVALQCGGEAFAYLRRREAMAFKR